MRPTERLFHATEELNRRALLELARPLAGARLLDLGCGDGAFTMRLAAHLGAAAVNGIEIEIEPAAEARRRGVDVALGDLGERLPYDDAGADVVHANQVIEHLPSTDHLLREIRRVLAPGGYALLSTNNLASLHNIVSLALGWQPPGCHVSDEVILGNPRNFADGRPGAAGRMHLRLFTARALSALAAHHGLRTDAARGAGYYPLPLAAARVAAAADPRHAAYVVLRLTRHDGAGA